MSLLTPIECTPLVKSQLHKTFPKLYHTIVLFILWLHLSLFLGVFCCYPQHAVSVGNPKPHAASSLAFGCKADSHLYCAVKPLEVQCNVSHMTLVVDLWRCQAARVTPRLSPVFTQSAGVSNEYILKGLPKTQGFEVCHYYGPEH